MAGALLLFVGFILGSTGPSGPRVRPAPSSTWSWTPAPSERVTLQRASFVNPAGWSPAKLTDGQVELRNADGDRLVVYALEFNWYWTPMKACAVDNMLAAKFAGQEAVPAPLPVLSLAGVPAEGLTLTSVSRFQAGWCAKPDPRAEQIYEVILDASRGPSGPAAMAAYRELLGSWRW